MFFVVEGEICLLNGKFNTSGVNIVEGDPNTVQVDGESGQMLISITPKAKKQGVSPVILGAPCENKLEPLSLFF